MGKMAFMFRDFTKKGTQLWVVQNSARRIKVQSNGSEEHSGMFLTFECNSGIQYDVEWKEKPTISKDADCPVNEQDEVHVLRKYTVLGVEPQRWVKIEATDEESSN